MIIGHSGRFLAPVCRASVLMRCDVFNDRVKRRCHHLVHFFGIVLPRQNTACSP